MLHCLGFPSNVSLTRHTDCGPGPEVCAAKRERSGGCNLDQSLKHWEIWSREQ